MTRSAQTAVVTGASTGIGRATAQAFAGAGWNVMATMRQPSAARGLVETSRLKLLTLDVQDPASVDAALKETIAAFGPIDVWVNNAGYGVFGPIEAASRNQIQRQFDVNVFGLIQCVKAIAPHFRANRKGTLINVSSAGGLATFPGYGTYNSSKFAVEGLSEALWYELGVFGIKVKVIEPGVTETDFGGRSMDILDISSLSEYAPVMAKINSARSRMTVKPNSPELVAAMILQAANDSSDRLRYLVGSDAKRIWRIRRWLGSRIQMRIVRLLAGL